MKFDSLESISLWQLNVTTLPTHVASELWRSCREQLPLMEKYAIIKEIGSGSFGKVFLVKSKQKGINYVIKKVDLSRLDKKQSLSASKEVELLAKLHHHNIVSYKESFEKNDQLNIVLEYCENGDLHEKIKEKRISNKCFAENEIFDYFVQISLALEYIHSNKILHRDLKTKNIFLTKGDVIKLGDFGIARVLENSFELAQTCIGSPFYVSPEICESKPYNKKSDVWALGCVLYEIATLRYAFVAKNVKTLVTKILTGAYNPLPTTTNVHIRNLISCMLKPNPADRPSVREILEKRFLIKRRATFICKAYRSDFYRRRSKSGDNRTLSSVVIRNEINKNVLNKKNSSFGRSELSQVKPNNISGPKAKYDPLQSPNLKNVKKLSFVAAWKIEKSEESDEMGMKFERNNKNESSKSSKSMKLPKVDSKYYDLIAGHRQTDHLEKKNESVGKQATDDEFDLTLKVNSQPVNQKMRKIPKIFPKIEEEIEEFGISSKNSSEHEESESTRNEASGKMEAVKEQRKRWMNNTLQKEALLAILSNSELLGRGMSYTSIERVSGENGLNLNLDAILTCDPSEISEDVLEPIKLNENEAEKENLRSNYLQLLQHEIAHLREKFEINNRNYQIEDLMRLTVNSKNILNLDVNQKYTEYDRKVGESVYHELECLRMTLERKIGMRNFLKVYGKMINIINDEFESGFKSSLENQTDGTETYVIKKVGIAGDSDDVVKNTWRSIISVLGEQQEYLPDIWELAMSENIYYHL